MSLSKQFLAISLQGNTYLSRVDRHNRSALLKAVVYQTQTQVNVIDDDDDILQVTSIAHDDDTATLLALYEKKKKNESEPTTAMEPLPTLSSSSTTTTTTSATACDSSGARTTPPSASLSRSFENSKSTKAAHRLLSYVVVTMTIVLFATSNDTCQVLRSNCTIQMHRQRVGS